VLDEVVDDVVFDIVLEATASLEVKLISLRSMISLLWFFATSTSLCAPAGTLGSSRTFWSASRVPMFVLSTNTSIRGRGIEFTSRFSSPTSAGIRVSTTTFTVPVTVAPSRGSTTLRR